MKNLSIIKMHFYVVLFCLIPELLFTSDYAIKIQKINDGVWMFNPDNNENIGRITLSNIGIIEGEEYAMIIDAGNSESFALRFLEELNNIISKPIKYLVLTHRHFDHTFGIEAYLNKEISIYMDKNEFEMLKSEGPRIKNMIFGNSKETEKIIDFKKIIKLKINHIDDKKILDLGNRKILLKNVGRAHTKGDIIVYDFKSKSYFAGDLVFVGRAATFSDANVKLWLDKYENIFNLPWLLMVPGHGRLIDRKEDLNDTKYWLEFVNNSIRRAIIEGDMISEVLDYNYPNKIIKLKLKEVTFKRGIKKQIKIYEEKNYIELN